MSEPVIPATHDIDAPPVLLAYQRAWLEDDADLKVCEKSRRTGLTWAEAADDVLIAAAQGGQNVYYIGYNQDMAVEYIEAAAMWARAFDYAASAIEEGLWEDDPDKHIKTFTIRFPSGRRIVALSSRPANLRGKQGVVVIDEAAFHERLGELLKAALALLIWGGKVRVISTHNGDQNPFNELINDIRAGRRAGSVQRIEFQEAVRQGLYQRVCLRLGEAWTPEGEPAWVRSVYEHYGEDAREELDVIPSAGDGVPLTRAAIEASMTDAPQILRLRLDDSFAHQPRHIREAEIRDWCDEHLAPLLAALDSSVRHFIGEDFGRVADLTDIWILAETQRLTFDTPAVIELRNVPFEQQRQVLFYLMDRLPKIGGAALDATGNGAYLAEVTMQRYGAAQVHEVKLSTEWYRQHMPRLIAAVQDRTVALPRDADIMADLRALRRIGGVVQLPRGARTRGADGGDRHGDSAIALALGIYAAYEIDSAPMEYQSTGHRRAGAELQGYQEEEHAAEAEVDIGFGAVRGRVDYGGYL